MLKVDPLSEAGQESATFALQKTIPSLPVPDLDATLQKLVRSAEALASSPAELADFQKAVNAFKQGEGAKLQQMLLSYAEGKRNWLEQIWVQMAYLAWPDTVHPQEGIAFRDVPAGVVFSRSERAAKIATALGHFARIIATGEYAPHKNAKGVANCMHFYSRTFRSARIPHPTADTQVHYQYSTHFIVSYKCTFYRVELFDSNGFLLPEEGVRERIEEIEREGNSRAAAAPGGEGGRFLPRLGSLTSWERPKWGKAREILEKDERNKQSLEEIDSAIFMMTLSDAMPMTVQEKLRLAMTSSSVLGSRWHDKSSQWIIFANGGVGASLEHSAADGLPVTVCNEHVARVMAAGGVASFDAKAVSSTQKIPSLRRLEWNVPDEVHLMIDDATAYSAAMAQVAMQLAYWRCFGRIDSVYESVGLIQFYHGRTETCRSVSVESVKFVKTMDDPRISNDQKLALLRAACDAHVRYCNEAAAGKGIDRHLLGLRVMAANSGQAAPPLFSHPLYLRSSSFPMTSSQLYSPLASAAIGFRAVTKEGVGVQYQLYDNSMVFGVFTDHRCPDTNSAKYLAHIDRALREMVTLLPATKPPASKL